MRHQAQKGFWVIFVEIPQHQKGYIMYVPSIRKIISSYDVIFDESLSSALAYTSQPYSEAMSMRPEVTYTPYDTSSKEQTGDIITFTHFEEGILLSETCEDAESGNKSDENSILPPLLSEEEMDEMDYGNETDDEPMSTQMLEDICDGIQSHPNVNMRDARYKIRDCIKQRQSVRKGALKTTQNMVKGLHKVCKNVVKEIFQDLPHLGESDSPV